MTTRKRPGAAAGLGLLALAGCATPGPLHVYHLATPAAAEVADTGPQGAATPACLQPGEEVVGFAYDPFTDHFFLRLAPGDRIRVVDRPARGVKREFTLPEGPWPGGDLALRPRDGHGFLLTGSAEVREITRLGRPLRRFTLAGVDRATGLAYDAAADQLWVLHADGRTVTRHGGDGARLGGFRLDRDAGASLAYDAERREWYAPLAAPGNGIGVFDADGRCVRRLEGPGHLVDVGPRSFIRVF